MMFSELNLRPKNDVKIIKFNGKDIEVYPSISTIEKGTLIENALELSYEAADGWYNPIKLDCFFYTEIMIRYTNIQIDEGTDYSEVFDLAKETGLLGAILAAIPKEEFDELVTQMEKMKEIRERIEESFTSRIQKVLADLPKEVTAAVNSINNFDTSKYAELSNFIKAANGGTTIE